MTKIVEPDDAISLGVEITKRDDERRLVFGFAKFAENPARRGTLLVDRQDDIVTPRDLEDAAYDYVLTSRDAGEMHETSGAGHLVESFMVTPDKLEKMGLAPDAVPQGWWVGYHVAPVEKGEVDPWDRIKSGEYGGFSIEGFGVREPVEIAEKVDDASEPEPEGEDLAKGHVDLDIDPWSDEGLDANAFAERRQMILELHRGNRITEAERDSLLQMLPPPEEYVALVAQQRAAREEEGLLARVRRALGLDAETSDREQF